MRQKSKYSRLMVHEIFTTAFGDIHAAYGAFVGGSHGDLLELQCVPGLLAFPMSQRAFAMDSCSSRSRSGVRQQTRGYIFERRAGSGDPPVSLRYTPLDQLFGRTQCLSPTVLYAAGIPREEVDRGSERTHCLGWLSTLLLRAGVACLLFEQTSVPRSSKFVSMLAQNSYVPEVPIVNILNIAEPRIARCERQREKNGDVK